MSSMKSLNPIAVVIGLAKAVMSQLDLVQTNKEKCLILNKMIESLVRPLGRLQEKAQVNENLEHFTKELEQILIDTQKLFEKLSDRKGFVQKVKGIVKADSDEGKIALIKERLTLLNHNATYLTLMKLHDNDHISRATRGPSFEVEFDTVCYFCYLTPEDLLIVGGSSKDIKKDFQIRAYDLDGEEQWHWQCPPEMGQPCDVASITIQDEDYLAIASEAGQMFLFHPDKHSLLAEPAYILPDMGKERLRRISHYDSHRLVVAVDPTWSAADDGKWSQLRVFKCGKTTFTEMKNKTIKLTNVVDTHSLTFLTRALVAVACGRHDNRIYVFNIDEGQSVWHLNPQRIGPSEVQPEAVLSIAGDLVVFDSSEVRLVSTNGKHWNDEELVSSLELGEMVYGLTWIKSSKQFVVLHEFKGKTRITLFNF